MVFAKRLAALKVAGAAAKAAQPQETAPMNMIDLGRPDYDSPPPLAQTLFGGSSDGPSTEGRIGVRQVHNLPPLLIV